MSQQMHERDIFLAALQIADDSAKSLYLRDACGEDSKLRNRIELLLINFANIGSFMDQKPPIDLQNDAENVGLAKAAENTVDYFPTTESFPLGEKITCIGEYEILSEIARGGMGIVFRARHIRLRRDVALKVILERSLADQLSSKRFEREAQLAASLQHPNIVRVFESDEHNGFRYLTMDYIEGNDLAFELRKGPLPPMSAADLVRLVASAVQYAHDRGICHRDLKPANILLDREGRPFVSDFGLAKAIAEIHSSTNAELTETGQILGTPGFMSPEQAAGNPAQDLPASDIYSLGAMLYALLVGHPPFLAATPIETLHQVIHQDPVAPRALNPKIPRDLETICLKCLRKNAKDRYASAGALAEDLTRWFDGKAIRARAIGPLARSWKWAKKHPAGASIVLVLALATVLTSWLWRSAVFANEAAAEELYLNRIAMADRGLAAGSRDEAISPLLKCSEKERGWEWRFFEALCYHSPHINLSVDSKEIRQVKFDPTGRFLGSVENDKVRVWDAVSFGLLSSIGESAKAIEFSADGSQTVLAIGSEVKLFSTLTSEFLKTLYAGADEILGICVDDSNHYLAVLDKKKRVTLCKFSNGEIVGAFAVDSAKTDEAWAADLPATFRFIQKTSNLLWPTAVEHAELWEGINVKKLQSFSQSDAANWEDGSLFKSGISPRCTELRGTDSRGQLYAYGSRIGGVPTMLYDIKKQAFVELDNPYSADTATIAFDPRGSFAALVRYRPSLEIEDAMTPRAPRDSRGFFSIIETFGTRDGVKHREFRDHSGRIGSLAIRADSRRMASAGTYLRRSLGSLSSHPDQPPIGELKVWDLEDSSPSMALQGHRSAITHVCISTFGEVVASVDESLEARIWKSTGQLLRVLHLHDENGNGFSKVRGLAFSSNGNLVVAMQDRIQWWNVEKATLHSEIRGDFAWMVGNASGTQIAYKSNRDEQVYVISANTEELVHYRKLDVPLRPHFDNADRLLELRLGTDNGINGSSLFDLFGNGAVSAQLEHARNPGMYEDTIITDTSLSADGNYLAAIGDHGRVFVWNARTGKQMTMISRSNTSMAIVPDGSRVACSFDNKILISKTTGGRDACVLRGHTSRINDIVFSRDGKFLVSGGTDKWVRIWGTAHLVNAPSLGDSTASASTPSLLAYSNELDVRSQWYVLCNRAMTKATREYENGIQSTVLNAISKSKLQTANRQPNTAIESELRKVVAAGTANKRDGVLEANLQSDAPLPQDVVSRALDDLLDHRIDRARIQRKSLTTVGTN